MDEERLLKQLSARHVTDGAFEALRTWLRRQPQVPDLLSRAAAAELLGVQSPYISRLHQQGRMPEPIEVEGSSPVYLRHEIEVLAKELSEQRAARQRARDKRKVEA